MRIRLKAITPVLAAGAAAVATGAAPIAAPQPAPAQPASIAAGPTVETVGHGGFGHGGFGHGGGWGGGGWHGGGWHDDGWHGAGWAPWFPPFGWRWWAAGRDGGSVVSVRVARVRFHGSCRTPGRGSRFSRVTPSAR